MYLLFDAKNLFASIARKAVLNGGVTLVIFLLIVSLVSLILYIILDNKNS